MANSEYTGWLAIIAMAVTMAIIIAMLMVKATMATRAMKAMLALSL